MKEKTYTVLVQQTLVLTKDDLSDIVIGALEGGIGYWAQLQNDTEDFKEYKDSELCVSEVVVELLVQGKVVKFQDTEEDTIYELTLEKVLEGIKVNSEKRPHDSNLDNADVNTYDCIFQYAMLGDVIYG